MGKVRIHAFVSGFVQDISFRSNTKRVAESLEINGWVRNLTDGRVEVVAEGKKENIEKLIQFLKRGPVGSRVENVEIKTGKCKGEFKGFKVVY